MRLHEMDPPIWLLICIREVPDSIFALDTNYPEILVIVVIHAKRMWRHYHFLPHPFCRDTNYPDILVIVVIHARQIWRHYRFLPHPFCFQFTNHPNIRRCIR